MSSQQDLSGQNEGFGGRFDPNPALGFPRWDGNNEPGLPNMHASGPAPPGMHPMPPGSWGFPRPMFPPFLPPPPHMSGPGPVGTPHPRPFPPPHMLPGHADFETMRLQSMLARSTERKDDDDDSVSADLRSVRQVHAPQFNAEQQNANQNQNQQQQGQFPPHLSQQLQHLQMQHHQHMMQQQQQQQQQQFHHQQQQQQQQDNNNNTNNNNANGSRAVGGLLNNGAPEFKLQGPGGRAVAAEPVEEAAAPVVKPPPQVFSLNVGGRTFAVHRKTLERHPSSLLHSLLLAEAADTPRDEEGNVFVDRDPSLFEVVLAYMRCGRLFVPPHVLYEALAAEAQYYRIPDLAKAHALAPRPNGDQSVLFRRQTNCTVKSRPNETAVFRVGAGDSFYVEAIRGRGTLLLRQKKAAEPRVIRELFKDETVRCKGDKDIFFIQPSEDEVLEFFVEDVRREQSVLHLTVNQTFKFALSNQTV